MVRVLPRKVEGAIGAQLLRALRSKMLKDSKLVKKSVFLRGLERHYYEREGEDPAILVCHGLGNEAKDMAGFIAALKLPNRIIVPDAIGHGADLHHAVKNLDKLPSALLQTTEDLLDALQITECHAFGHSLGGAFVYYLKHKRPDILRKTVLVSPSIDTCLDSNFVEDFLSHKKNHFCFETRNDVKIFMRDLSIPNAKKRHPVPKFFFEAILREGKRIEEKRYFRGVMNVLLEHRGKDETMSCTEDIDCNAERLVLWPEQDSISSFESGKAFFAQSKCTKFVSLPDCGHVFLSDGTFLLDHVAPMVSEYFSTTTKQDAMSVFLEEFGKSCKGQDVSVRSNACSTK